MEVFGVNKPSATLIDLLIKTIEEKLMNITIEKIANNFLKSTGSMSKEDYCYIEDTD